MWKESRKFKHGSFYFLIFFYLSQKCDMEMSNLYNDLFTSCIMSHNDIYSLSQTVLSSITTSREEKALIELSTDSENCS